MPSANEIRERLGSWMQDNGNRVEYGGGPPHDGGMEARVAKLEAVSEYIQRDVGEIRTELKDVSHAIRKFADDVNEEFRNVRTEIRTETWKILSVLGAMFLFLFGAIAAGFKWF